MRGPRRPPGLDPDLLDLEPEDVAAWPQDVQDQLYRKFQDLEPELLSGEPEEVEAHLSRRDQWFSRYDAATRSSRSPPAPRPCAKPAST